MPVIDKKKAKTAGATLVIAAAAGFFMQNGVPLPGGAPLSKPTMVSAAVPNEPASEVLASDAPLPAPTVEQAPEVTRADVVPILAQPPQPILPFADPDTPEPVIEAALQSDPVETDTPEPTATPDCETGFTATSAPAAMVTLALESPCHAGQVVEILHEGLRINERLDDGGLTRIDLPALSEDAVFTANFTDGSQAETEIFMPTLADYERIALVWKGITGMGLHALEGGATYDEPGHMHANQMGSADRATTGEGGFMTVVGSVPGGWTADIYTYPVALINAGRSPDVSVEAEILAEACDAPTRATLLRISPRDGLGSSELSFGAPGCDAVGEFLVLKNLPQDLKIASN
ncbi:hypothetical protein [Aliiroseovarius sp.]|uniref:hypothetical protein n=1 Tax=Aliiroseovarius sp. TaxID=1872442 RepID=UPI003BAB7BBC